MKRVQRAGEIVTGEGIDYNSLRRQVRKGALQQVRRGTYTRVDQQTRERQQRLTIEAVALQRKDAIIAGNSAATFWGLPRTRQGLDLVTIYSAHGHGRLCAGVRQRLGTLDDEDVREVQGITVTSVARTIVDIARWDGLVWGVIAADAALHGDLVTAAELDAALVTAGRIQGLGQARRAIHLADARAESALESLSRVQMVKLGIPKPELQYSLRLRDGSVARVDFAWPELRVAGECDGGIKYDDLLVPGQTAKSVVLAEKRREEQIRELGWWPFRWTWAEAWALDRFEPRLRAGLASSPRRAA